MLPLRLVLVRNIRAGSVWSHAKFSSRDGGNKGDGDSSIISDIEEDKSVVHKKDTKAAKRDSQVMSDPEKSRIASLKLNDLLQSMLKEESSRKMSNSLELTKPKSRKKESKKISTPSLGEQVVEAVEHVAHELGGDEGKTQSELLEKVADTVGQSQVPDRPATQDTPRITPTKSPINLSDLIAGMKIDRSQPEKAESSGRAQQVRRMLAAEPARRDDPNSVSASMLRRPSQPRQQREAATPAGLNEGVALGIFDVEKTEVVASGETSDDVWNQLQQRELRLAITHPPANIFEEMILWTNQGKLWHFPINNEQGMEWESNVHFSEHVFLERHIEDWCPKRGPVRHFMELVCVGLSKNPYLTIEEKKNHIAWYKEYFAEKEALLKEVGAIS